MDILNAAVVARWAEDLELALRDFYGGTMPPHITEDLAQFPLGESARANALRYARSYFWYWRGFDAYNAAHDTQSEDVQRAVRQLMRREPEVVTLAGRRVAVTGRSYNALAEIAAHQLRLNELHEAIENVATLHARTLMRFAGWWARRRVRRRLALLHRIHSQLYTECLLHRRALYAHALTSNGAPATDVETSHPAPWWREATPDDDARLLLALFEVGPGRYWKLPDSVRNEADRSPFSEDFGFHSLITWVEGKRKLSPAALYNQDIGQVLVSLRAGALAAPDSDSVED